jgi:hypothetical protein
MGPSRLRCRHCGGKVGTKRGSLNPNWKGGRKLLNVGYFVVYISSDDFFHPMADKKRYVLEHRLVMAKHLNRCLLPWEVVHHKNGIKTDNRIENLELLGCHGRHNTQIERVLNKQEGQIKELQARVTALEAENTLLRAEDERSYADNQQ